MQTNREKILENITKNGFTTPHNLSREIGIGPTMVHRYLKELVSAGKIIKQGSGPKVFYTLNTELFTHTKTIPANPLIEQTFTFITPTGTELLGMQGFIQWCQQRKYDIDQKVVEYEKVYQQYEPFKKKGVIDATAKIENTFSSDKRFLDHLYFLYPYSLPVFGKTKIATWLFHGKQTQNKLLMKRVLEVIIPEIQKFITSNNYDGVAFVPPSVPRETQFMKLLQKTLQTHLPTVTIEKIKNTIIIQQKSLKDLQDRITNAEGTMLVTSSGHYKKVLIIDDFTGSGSTLNVIAGKIKSRNIAQIVDGLTITGSMNGFEIIREV